MLSAVSKWKNFRAKHPVVVKTAKGALIVMPIWVEPTWSLVSDKPLIPAFLGWAQEAWGQRAPGLLNWLVVAGLALLFYSPEIKRFLSKTPSLEPGDEPALSPLSTEAEAESESVHHKSVGGSASIINLVGTISKDQVGVRLVVNSEDADSVDDYAHCVTGVFIWRDQLDKPRYIQQDSDARRQSWPQGQPTGVGVQLSSTVLVWHQGSGFSRPGKVGPLNPLYREAGIYWVKILLRADGEIVSWHLHFDFRPGEGFRQPSPGTTEGPTQ